MATVSKMIVNGNEYDIRDNNAHAKIGTVPSGETVESQIGELINAIEDSSGLLIIDGKRNGQSGDNNGLTYVWDGDECTVTGTSTATSFNNLYDTNEDGWGYFAPGGTYQIEISSEDVRLQFYVYKSDSTTESLVSAFENRFVTIPNNTTRLIVRLRVNSGLTVTETVKPKVYSNNLPAARSAVINSDRRCYMYSTYEPGFVLDGTTIKLSPGYVMAHYKKENGEIAEKIINNNYTEISVPHDSFAIVNIDKNTIEVKTGLELKTLINTNYAVMFYNSNGVIKGDFAIYPINSALSDNYELFFYGANACPKFSTDAQNNIKVDVTGLLPRANNKEINSAGGIRYRGGISRNIQETVFTVPHDKCLVFNYDSQSIEVANATTDYAKGNALLFYNSHGSVNGPWRTYWLQDKLKNVQNNDTSIPDYYQEHMDEKGEQINLQLSEITSGDGFVFITDVHYNKNKMKSPSLVQNICRKTGITSIHLNGDQITKETSRELALMKINEINSVYHFPEFTTYMTVGNHEWNNPTASSSEEALAIQVNENNMRFAFVNPMRKDVTFDSDSISYYYDNTVSKIRYIVGEVSRGSTIILNSAKWIAEKMADAPSGYGLVVIMHTILGYTKDDDVYTPHIQNSTAATVLINAIDAARAGTSYTYDGVTYDYSGKNLEMIAAFCGDTHVDLFLRTPGGVPIICTTTDSMDEEGTITRESGTITEQAFDVVVIDRGAKKIYVNRIGAGSDREYDFAESN